MNRRVWTGVAAGVLAATVLLGVAAGAYRAGRHQEVVTRTAGDGEVVRVVRGNGWGHGPGPGFILFPLAIAAIVFLAVGRRGGPGWGPGHQPPYGPPEDAFREWHRRAHTESGATTSPTTSTGPPQG